VRLVRQHRKNQKRAPNPANALHEGWPHVFVIGACGIGYADVLALARTKRQADAIAVLHVALAVGDAVLDIAARRSTKGVSLIYTGRKGRPRRERCRVLRHRHWPKEPWRHESRGDPWPFG
jgi:hypothetical protein